MSSAPSADYTLQILEYFAAADCPLGISDLSNALNINKNATFRVLGSLIEHGWVYCSDPAQKKYSLSLKPFSMISKFFSDNPLVKIADPHLCALHAIVPDSVYLGVKNGRNIMYRLHYDSTRLVRINGCVGGEYPLHLSAPGKILLAWSSAREIDGYFNGHLPDDVAQSFQEDIPRIRTRGYAIDNEEYSKGIICYAAPIFDHKGDVIASVGVSSLTIFDTVEGLIANQGVHVSDCARRISTALGYHT